MNPTEPAIEQSSQTENTKGVAHKAADKVRESAERAKEAAAGFADDQKQRAADRIGGYGSALRDTAESVRSEDPNIAWLTEQASSRLKHAAEYVRNSSWSQLREDGAGLARRHPVVFYGGMFVLGAAAGALIKAALPDGSDGGKSGSEDFRAGDDDGRTSYVPGAAPVETAPSVETKL